MSRFYRLVFALLLTSTISACEDDASSSELDTTDVAITERANIDVAWSGSVLPGADALHVTVGKIRIGTPAAPQLRASNGGPGVPDPEPEKSDGVRWVTVMPGPVTLDVLHPNQGAIQPIGHAQVLPSTYSEIEVEILGAVVVRNGVQLPVALQPGAATTLRWSNKMAASTTTPLSLTLGLDLSGSAELLLAATPSWRPQATAQVNPV